MAALYIHNAVFSPDPSPRSHRHIRNLSSLSEGTLHSSISMHSHPTEPLLHSNTPESLAYRDLLLSQPLYPDEPGRNLGLSFEGDKTTAQERKGHWEKEVKRKLRWLKLVKGVLEVLFGAWATYNIVAYFLAYMRYASKEGQAASLALGTCVTVALALLSASALISLFRPDLLLNDIPIHYLLTLRTLLQYCWLLFLLAPALVSFALTFAWRSSSDSEVRLQSRCALSIDVVWASPGSSCPPSKIPWGVWLTLSIVRLLLTLIIIIFYLVVSREYHNIRRPSQRPFRRRRHRFRPSKPAHGPTAQSHQGINADLPTPPSPLARSSHQQLSLGSPRHSRSKPSVLYPSDYSAPRPISSASSEDSGETTALTRPSQMLPALGTSSNEVQQGPGTDLHGFVDRFNSLVGQIAQEADEGLELALYEPSLVSDSNASDDAFDPYLGYPISAIPKPDRIHVLGGVIHRLSTIESVGSREQARSSLSGDRDEATASSDPSLYISSPTRSNTRSTTLSVKSQGRGSSGDIAHLKQKELGELSGSGVSLGAHDSVLSMSNNRDSDSSYYASLHRTMQYLPGEMTTPPGL